MRDSDKASEPTAGQPCLQTTNTPLCTARHAAYHTVSTHTHTPGGAWRLLPPEVAALLDAGAATPPKAVPVLVPGPPPKEKEGVVVEGGAPAAGAAPLPGAAAEAGGAPPNVNAGVEAAAVVEAAGAPPKVNGAEVVAADGEAAGAPPKVNGAEAVAADVDAAGAGAAAEPCCGRGCEVGPEAGGVIPPKLEVVAPKAWEGWEALPV